MDFYTASGLGVAGVIVAFFVISHFYNRFVVQPQRKRGRPAQGIPRLTNSMFKNGYSGKEPVQWLNHKSFSNVPYKVKKVVSLRNFNVLLNLMTIALFALQNPDWWIIPVIQTVANIIAYAPKHQTRNRIVFKMCEAAHKKLLWGPSALITPWAFVRVQEWDQNSPIKIELKLLTDFDATNPATKDNFERQFNNVVSNKNSWSYDWDPAEGKISVIPVALLPEMATYPGSTGQEWNEFAVGEGINGPVTYDIQKYPHVLVGGTTGSGKSVLQRNIIFHCIQHNYMWRFLGVDLKRVELGPFKKYETTVMGIASELEDGVEIVRYAQRVMNTRYTQMEEAGVNHFKDLIDPKTGKTKERALLIMVDEAAMFMGTEGVKTDEGKARDELHGEAVGIIGALARLGRASGIHLLLATQRPDATFIPGETKNNLDVRIAAGRLDSTPSSMILDNGAATMLPGHIKGRGVIRYSGINQEFQGYYAEPDWIDEWLKENPGVEPTINPAPGQVTDDELDDLPPGIDFEDGIMSLEADVMAPNLEEFAEKIEAAHDEALENGEAETELKPKKKGLFGKKKKKESEDSSDEEETVEDYSELNQEPEPEPVMPSPEPTVEPEPEPAELFLNEDDEETEVEEIAELPPKQQEPKPEPEMTPTERKILKSLRELSGEQVDEEEKPRLDPLEDFNLDEEVSGIPAFAPETSRDNILPGTEEEPSFAEPKKSAPAFPAPAKNFTPPKKGFPPPPPTTPGGKARTSLPLPPPPKGFPRPPAKSG